MRHPGRVPRGAAWRWRARRGRAGAAALLALTAAIGTTCATIGIRDLSRTLPARGYVLPSGLRVVIEEDPSATLVGAAWMVDAGEVDDPPHRRELAHTVEHLLFELPDGAGVSAWQRLRDLGGVERRPCLRSSDPIGPDHGADASRGRPLDRSRRARRERRPGHRRRRGSRGPCPARCR